VVSVRDVALADEGGGLSLAADAAGFPAAEENLPEPATTGEFPVAGSEYLATGQATTTQEEYPTTTSPFRRSPSGDPGSL